MPNDAPAVRANLVGEDGFASVEEAQRFLGGVSRSTLYGYMRSGELPFALLGKLRRIPRQALRAFAARLMVSK
jgi:excisionase family DNA binding protein